MVTRRINNIKWCGLLMCFSCLQACVTGKEDKLQVALEIAGDNRSELVDVLDHYATEGDSLKYKAACFLIENMIGRRARYVEWYDGDGKLIHPEFSEPRKSELFKRKADSCGWYSKEVVCEPDLQIMKSDYLIKHIDYAFKGWVRPWAKHFTFNQFCEWLLPYRVGNEKLESWQEIVRKEFAYLEEVLKDLQGPNQAYDAIDYDLFTWFKYGECAYQLSPDQSISEMLQYKIGTCDDYCTLRCYLMRAFGVPVAIDRAIKWGNRNGAHGETAVLDSSGNASPYFPLYEKVEKKGRAAGKIWRKTYAIQEQCLAMKVEDIHTIPEVFWDVHYVDASKDHAPVKDILLLIPQCEDTLVYMAVFNYGEWQPVWWGIKNGEEFCFTDMISRVVYLPVNYRNGSVSPMHAPVWLDEQGELHSLKPDLNCLAEVVVDSVKEAYLPGGLIKGEVYQLYYWNNEEWKWLSEDKCVGGALKFERVPGGVLLRLIRPGNYKNDERIFIKWDDEVKWF